MSIEFYEGTGQVNIYMAEGCCGAKLRIKVGCNTEALKFSGGFKLACIDEEASIDDQGNYYSEKRSITGTKPECTACLSRLCANLKNNKLRGYDYWKIRPDQYPH